MELDRYEIQFKAEVDLEESTFEGRSAGIGNLDHGDDIIEPGAFKKTIRERLSRGYVKLIDGHDAMSTRNVWGKAIEAEEQPFQKLPGKQPKGDVPTHVLWTKFFVTRAEQAAQAALRKIEERVLNALSIGYAPVKVVYEPKDTDEFDEDQDPVWEWYMGRAARRIKELKWMETSLVTWGMNSFAEIIPGTVKRLVEHAHRVTESGVPVSEIEVKRAIQALNSVLQGDEQRVRQELANKVPLQVPVDVDVPDGGKAQGDDPAPVNDDTPGATASDDPEAATKVDTPEPSEEDTPAEPSTTEGHFPSDEQLETYLAAIDLAERELAQT